MGVGHFAVACTSAGGAEEITASRIVRRAALVLLAVVVVGSEQGTLKAAEGSAWEPLEGIKETVAELGADDQAPEHHLEGLGVAPRLQRSFHWPPPSTPPRTPLLTFSLSAAPLPRPPASVLADPIALAALASHPALFSRHSPLKLAAIKESLADHPNYAWVESLVESLEKGFWPAHDGSAPSPPPQAKTPLYPRRREDQLLQEEKARKAVADGWISEAVDELPEGAVVSPQFVLRKPGASPRLIDDHAASGLNSGIADVPCVYDRVSDLIALLRFLGLLDDSLPSSAVLFKLDVSSAFKILLVSPFWQLRQGIAVAYAQPGGGPPRIRYHLQWRAAFGSKASPYLWTSFMAAVHWVIVKRVPSVPYPLSYMDDNYGIDLSGRTTLVLNRGEIRRVPVAQGGVMEVWKEWGIPFSWEKAESGRRLLITGLVIDLDSATIFLPPSSVARFADEVESFLSAPSSAPRRQPLRRWRQLAGWANWALTVAPHARPLLSPLFAKLRLTNGSTRTSPYNPIFYNNEVRNSLNSFVRVLEEEPAMDLRSPGLTEWGAGDADVTVYTDACLEEDGGSGSGLGFWYQLGGRRRHYFARPKVRWVSIQFAESLTVACAILHILSLVGTSLLPSLHRLLIRTDSAPAVFAFDSGKGQDTASSPIHLLLLTTFSSLRLKKVDLHVRHISGKLNTTADFLSRAPPKELASTYRSSVSSFVPPPALVGRALTK